MSNTITVEKAAAGLSELIRSLEPGDEIVIMENDQPVARILPSASVSASTEKLPNRVPGLWKGKLIEISDDDDHLEDFKDYM